MLNNYSVDEDDSKREEKINSDYVGQSVWVRGVVTEVAAEFSGGVLITVDTTDVDGEDDTTDLLMTFDSDDIKESDENDS